MLSIGGAASYADEHGLPAAADQRRVVTDLRSTAPILLLALVLAGCSPATDHWENDAYVWAGSHAPDPAIAALPLARHRLLLLQWQADGGSSPRRFDRRPWLTAFEHTPVVAVVRLDGYRIAAGPREVTEALKAEMADWPREPVAVEIDHDAATARIGDYARWLSDFKTLWENRSPIWITALPDWQHSPSFGALLRAVDAVTLQVHAVDRPDAGLLVPERALAVVRIFEQTAATPLFVALPTYQLRVGWNANGSVRFVEGEQPVAASATREQTLFVDPEGLAALARTLRETRTARRRGVAWYRLPREGDRQSLSMATFSALVSEAPTSQVVDIQAKPGSDGATHDLVLHNPGPLDGSLPAAISWAAGCAVGDAAFGYHTGRTRNELERDSPGLLRAGEQRTIGWIRCARDEQPTPVIVANEP
jgi:hypothetical protein